MSQTAAHQFHSLDNLYFEENPFDSLLDRIYVSILIDMPIIS